jgi:hypothetical protein
MSQKRDIRAAPGTPGGSTAAFRGATNEQVAARFGVNTQFAQMQMPGARSFAVRALAKQDRQSAELRLRSARGVRRGVLAVLLVSAESGPGRRS